LIVLQKGTKAPQAAGRIHTDFEKGFIMAEVMKFDDFKEEGTEAACKVRRVPIRNYKLLYKNKGILLLLNYKVKCSLYYLIFTKYYFEFF